MRYNTLQLVNQVLTATDQSGVSTINETEEASQVLSILRRTITELDLDMNWVPRRTVARLSTSSGTAFTVGTDNWKDDYPDIPWTMALPTGVEAVYAIYYNSKLLDYIEPSEFLYRIEKTTALKNTGDPSYWTLGLMDQDYVLFNSFDATTESYLTSSNSLAHVLQYPQTDVSADTDAIDLSDKFYPALINKAISKCFYELLGDANMGDRYNREYNIAKNKLNRNAKRSTQRTPALGTINYGRRGNGGNGIAIDPSRVTDASA